MIAVLMVSPGTLLGVVMAPVDGRYSQARIAAEGLVYLGLLLAIMLSAPGRQVLAKLSHAARRTGWILLFLILTGRSLED